MNGHIKCTFNQITAFVHFRLTATRLALVNWTVSVKNSNPLTKHAFLSPVAKWNTIRAQLRMFKKNIFDPSPHPDLKSLVEVCKIMQKPDLTSPNTMIRLMVHKHEAVTVFLCVCGFRVSSSKEIGCAAKPNHQHQKGSMSLFKQQLFPDQRHHTNQSYLKANESMYVTIIIIIPSTQNGHFLGGSCWEWGYLLHPHRCLHHCGSPGPR